MGCLSREAFLSFLESLIFFFFFFFEWKWRGSDFSQDVLYEKNKKQAKKQIEITITTVTMGRKQPALMNLNE